MTKKLRHPRRFQAIMAILNAIPRLKKATVTSLHHNLHMGEYRLKFLLELLWKTGYIEYSSGTFKGHPKGHICLLPSYELSYYGGQWLREANRLMSELQR